MRAVRPVLAIALVASPAAAIGQSEVSAERGLKISIIGGCHDCHTEGYSESNGAVDPDKALKGRSICFRGPRGTSYPTNLRLRAQGMTEETYVIYLKNLTNTPPMPWYNLRAMDDDEIRSLHRYIVSLGEAGEHPSTPIYSDPDKCIDLAPLGGAS